MNNLRLIAKDMLSCAIADVFASEVPILKNSAYEWLLLHRNPTKEEITDPKPWDYIAVCRELGISWYRLRDDIKGALGLLSDRKLGIDEGLLAIDFPISPTIH